MRYVKKKAKKKWYKRLSQSHLRRSDRNRPSRGYRL
jgi:hypothetical protein